MSPGSLCTDSDEFMFGDQFMSGSPDTFVSEENNIGNESPEEDVYSINVDTSLPGHLVDERVLLIRNEQGMFSRNETHIHYYLPSELLQSSLFLEEDGHFNPLRVVKQIEEGFAENPIFKNSKCSFLKQSSFVGIIQVKVLESLVTISNVPIHTTLFKVVECPSLKGNVMIL